MSTHDTNGPHSDLDQATADRLGRLRTMPVDTSRLEQALLAQIPRPDEPAEASGQRARRHTGPSRWLRPLRAVAASLVLLSAVAAVVLLSSSGGPAMASAAQMARMHEDLVAGRVPVTQVGSIDEANRALAGQWADVPQLPAVPQSHVMACCMKSVKDKRVACVLLKAGGAAGEPVTMTVANAADVRAPDSPVVVRAGVAYHVQSADGLNMVMAERHGRWVCLIGRVPAERLMDLAAGLQF